MTGLDLETIGYLTPEEDGRDAYRNRAGRDACPWLPETEECVAWLKGWDDACREDCSDE